MKILAEKCVKITNEMYYVVLILLSFSAFFSLYLLLILKKYPMSVEMKIYDIR